MRSNTVKITYDVLNWFNLEKIEGNERIILHFIKIWGEKTTNNQAKNPQKHQNITQTNKTNNKTKTKQTTPQKKPKTNKKNPKKPMQQ